MKTVVVFASLLLILATSGCSWFKPTWSETPPEKTSRPVTATPVTTPTNSVTEGAPATQGTEATPVTVPQVAPTADWAAPVVTNQVPVEKPKKEAKSKKAAKTAPPKLIITPDLSLSAKVVSVNAAGRFVILSFPAEKMPKLQQTMFIYRAGLKVAEVKVTGPQQDNNTVADIVSGDAMVGDTVRED